MNNQQTTQHITGWPHKLYHNITKTLTEDWRTNTYYPFAVILFILTTLLVVVYYINHPKPELYLDTGEYLSQVQLIQTHWQIVDPHRVPGFPLLITLVFALSGQGNVMAVSIVHAMLFVLSTLEIYVIALIVLRRAWIAFLVGLLVGTNISLLTFVKPILSETLSLWLAVSLALAAVLFVHTSRVRHLWIAAAFAIALFMTRAEWIYLPLPLFAYLILAAVRHGSATRRLLFHALASVALIYAILGGYIYINATQYNYLGVADTQNFNAWGKVIQYGMQNEAPPQYAMVTQITNKFRSQGGLNPYNLVQQYPLLASDHYSLVGDYAKSIIQKHPVEFIEKSVPVAFSSLPDFYYESQIDPQGPFGSTLLKVQSAYQLLYKMNMLFPMCAVAWIFLLFWRRTARLRTVHAMGAIILLVLYGVIITTLGGFASYPRYHTPFNPLLIIIIWGSLLAAIQLIVYYRPRIIARIARQPL